MVVLGKTLVVVGRRSKAFFKSIACLKKVPKFIEKGLMIIPVRVEEPERRGIDIARNTERMWPDEMIQRYARTETSNKNAYSATLNKIKVQRYDVRKVLRELITLPAQGYLFGYSTGLQDLVSRFEGIVYPPPS